MDCTKVRKLFIGYIDNALNISDREKVDLHISMCSECRSEMEALAGVSEELRQAFHTATAGVSPSPNAWLNIKDQLYSKHGSEGFWDRIKAR
ncbi:MAG: zf-HC2 domain-containing protein, partial [Chloroflexi bacterium]|nr:zf-HC2 domain-containing protein [Chloroflexota bacterium]